MFFRSLEYIRSKPKAVREQYALWLTVVIVGSIGFVWVVTLPGRFMSVDAELTDTGPEITRPFMQFVAQFQSGDNVAGEAATSTTVATTTAPMSASPPPATTSPAQLELSPENLARMGAANDTAAASTTTSTTTSAESTPPPAGRPVLITTTTTTATSTDE